MLRNDKDGRGIGFTLILLLELLLMLGLLKPDDLIMAYFCISYGVVWCGVCIED